MPDRSVDHRKAVFARHRLVAGRLLVRFRSSQAWENIGGLAWVEVTAIELGRDHHGQILARPAILHPFLIGRCTQKVAAERDEALDPPFDQPFHRIDDMHPVLGRGIEIEQLFQLFKWNQMGFFGDANRPLALDIRMTAHRTAPCPFAPDIAAQQQQIDHHCDIERAMRVLGESHAIDADHLVGLDIDLSRLAQRRFR